MLLSIQEVVTLTNDSYKEGYQKACDDILKILEFRPTTCKEEISFLHHRNGNPNDNRIENLLMKEA